MRPAPLLLPLLSGLLIACDPEPAAPAAASEAPEGAETHSQPTAEAGGGDYAGVPVKSQGAPIEMAPDEARELDAPTQRVKELVEAKDCATAMPEAEALLARDPEDPDLHYLHGRCLELAQRWPDAAAAYKRAVAADPDFLGALRHLGLALVMTRRCDEALPYLDHSVELQPDEGSAYYNRGHCRYFLKDLEGALADAEKGCSLAYEPSCTIIDKIEKRQAWVKNLEKRNKDANPEALDAQK